MNYELVRVSEQKLTAYLAQDLSGTTQRIIRSLSESDRTIGCAESLTGGLLADALVRTDGASQAFVGSVVSYATRIKHSVLHVSQELLNAQGAVDPQVAYEMSMGARESLECDVAVSATGVAGPTPQDGKPVGTVYVAVTSDKRSVVLDLDLSKVTGQEFSAAVAATQREAVRRATVCVAFGYLCEQFGKFS